MSMRTLGCLIVAAVLQLIALAAPAQTYSYHVYIDSDLRNATGCTASGGGQTFLGADYRLTATVTGSPPIVTARTLSPCVAGSFAPGSALSANYPVGLNNGLPLSGGAAADVIELSVARSLLPGVEPQVRVGFGAQSASGSVDVLYTVDGTVNGLPMVIGSPALIPTLGFFGGLLLALALAALAMRSLRRNRLMAQMLMVGAFVSLGFAAWAVVTHIADGQVGDWAGDAPIGTDPIGDSVPPLSGTDIVGAFGVDVRPNLHFRIDVVDAENRPPVAVNDSYTTLEDTALNVAAPGVLGNDSDPDGDPITAQLVSGPSKGTLTLNANGSFSYTPNANANGPDTFTYNAFDGQVVSATPATVTINITPVNDVPVFTAGPNQTVLEDAGPQTVNPWATGVDDGDPEVVQALTFNITNNTNPALFSAGPTVSAAGVLSYTPAANANGVATITLNLMDDGGTANGGIDTSAPQSFTITVTAVNDPPSFVAGPNQSVLEDAGPQTVNPWATAISPGPPDEAGQTVSFEIVSNSNPALFSAAPAVSPTGVLSYAAAANANGVATIAVRARDDGGTANGGIDASAPQNFTITVTAVNDVPVFTAGPNQTVLEDAGPQTVNPWATGIDDGDPEVVQGLSFNITGNTNPALFSAGPSVSPTGVLSYTPAANANGTATITLNLMDDGGTANGGIDTSAPQSFTITVTAVNDAPSFTKGPDQTVLEDAGPQTVNPWATAISAGPPDESGQTVVFNMTGNTNPALFSAAPAVSPTGVLTYTPAANANGSATITLNLMDNGGTANGGVDTSAAQTFVINVTAVNDAPVNTVPAAQNTGDTVPLVLSTANTNAISVVDIDAGAGIVQMSFGTGAPANGTLTLANPGSVLTTLSGNGTDQVIATGTLAALNAALNGPSGSLTYTPVPGTSAARTITVITNDQGNTGVGGAQIDTDIITVNVDAAPIVTSTPAAGATTANNVAITVNFSEPVNVIAGITLTCGGPNLITGGSTGSNVSSLNLAYTAPLPSGSCTLFVPAASVTDVDLIDPPNNPVANYTAVFSVDAAPAFVSSTPAAGAIVANNAVFSAVFSEPVNFGMGGFTLDCGGPIAVTPSGSGTSTLTFTPAAALPNGAACTATLIAANITDVDAFDPPDNLPANVVVNFSVDAAPTFVSAVPAAAAVVGTGQVISFTFDEPVNNLGAAITLNCGGPVAGVISGSGSATLSFTPSAALTAGASCTATAVAAQIGDVDVIDPPQNPIADVLRNFTVDSAPTVVSTSPSNGASSVPLAGVVSFNFSEAVSFGVPSFTYSCGAPVTFTVSGSGTATATLTPTSLLPINTLCTVTALAAGISDVDAADPPDLMAANVAISFTSVNDNPPAVQSVTPANGATVANNTPLSVVFTENVDAVAGAVTLTCGGLNLITGGTSGTNVPSLTPTYAPPLPNGALCTLTVLAANITDSDLIDPPDNMVANFVSTFTVDAAPGVSSVLPGNGASNLATNTTITVNFSEAVDVAAGGVTLDCGAPVSFSAGLPATNVSSVTLTPSANLPEGATCNGTVVATSVTDADLIDPPDQMVTNFTWSFTTDAAPSVTTVTPAAAATVPSNQLLTINFSENVDLSASAFTLNCGAAVPFSSVPALPATATNTITLTPTGGLTQGSACTLTVVAAQVSDSDLNDPPNNMAANFVRSFSVDAAPSVTTTTPANGATAVDPTTSITINFSESVNFDTTANAANTSFDLECPTPTAVNFTVVTASPASSVVLDPLDSAIAGATCTLTVQASGITDADAVDPPDSMAANFSASFTYAALANDDAYTVTPHLTLGIGAASPQGGGVLGNDVLGAGVITGFGFAPACTGTAPGIQLDAGAANGRLTLNADGGFSYEPPAGIADSTRTFCYTVTGGDTANVVFTLQNTELVWFIDAAAPGGGIGTQARPFQTLAAADAVDTTNDTLYLEFNASAYSSAGLTLLAGERLIGRGSGSTLDALSGVTPVAGSAHPALGGSAPSITCSGITCVTLGTGNTLRGFTIGNSGAAGTDLAGTNFGTLTVAELTLNGDGRALNLSTGTVSGNFLDIDASSGNNQGISLNGVDGSWSVTAQVNIGNVAGTGINLINLPGTASATFTGGLVVSKTSAGTAVNLANNTGSQINLGVVSLTAGNGTGLFINQSPLTLTGTTGTVVSTGGPAIDATGANFGAGATLATVSASVTAGASKGINLDSNAGSLVMNGGFVNVSGSGIAFDLTGGNGTVTYAGNIISNASSRLVEVTGRTGGTVTFAGTLDGQGPAHTGINVAGNTGGTINFSGGTQTFVTVTNPAVTLSANTGATINFTGGNLSLSTTSGTAFSAAGGAAGISVQGSGNSISTASGTALSVVSTNIAASGLNFRSISSGAGANNGIVLDTTGSAGGLTVNGDGANTALGGNGSGGTIAGKTGADGSTTAGIGIYLNSTSNVVLRRMTINGNHQNYGIRGFAVNNLTLEYSTVSGLNGTNLTLGTYGEGGVYFGGATGATGLTGSATVTSSVFSGARARNFSVVNTSGTLNRLTITNSSFGLTDNASDNDSLALEARNAGTVLNATVTGSTFTGAAGDIGDFTGQTGTTMDVVFQNNTVSNSHPLNNIGGGGMTFATQGSYTFNASNNTFRDANGSAITLFKASAGTLLSGTFANNTIGVSGVANSGSATGNGIFLSAAGSGTITLAITNNQIRRYSGNAAIFADNTGGNYTVNLTATGNVAAEPGGGAFAGLALTAGAPASSDAVAVCAQLGGAGALRNDFSAGDPANANDIILGVSTGGSSMRLPGYAGASLAAVQTFVFNNNNFAGTAVTAYIDPPATAANFTGGAACPLP
ncbi:MAG: Ig-like domain-containing protein [Lysobacterales bacterium]